MKSIFLILFFGMNAFAGDPSCTTVTNVTTGDSYTASNTDCIIRVARPFSTTSFRVNLPETGDTFTVQNGASYDGDNCENFGDEEDPLFYCNPRALTVYSSGSGTVDGSTSVTDAGYYAQGSPTRSSDTFTWNSGTSNFDATYDYWAGP